VIAKRGQRKVHYCTSGNKSQVTVVACIKATGKLSGDNYCACKRWMHVDCISETVVDSNGNLRMYSYCIL